MTNERAYHEKDILQRLAEYDPDVSPISTVLDARAEIERLRAALLKAKRPHYGCEDTYYSCPKHPEGCSRDGAGRDCDCGADKFNAEIDAILGGTDEPKAPLRARLTVERGMVKIAVLEGRPEIPPDGDYDVVGTALKST
jgi:hypothetical protein